MRIIYALIIISIISCKGTDNSADYQPVKNYISYETRAEGQAMDADWCVETQMQLASLEGSAVGRDHIDEIIYARFTDLSGTPTNIIPDDEKPLKTGGFLSYMGLPKTSHFGTRIPKEINCKFRTQDSIESLLGVDIEGDEGSCRDMNQRALDWAKSRLTAEQLERYEGTGKKLVFVQDEVTGMGSGWISEEIKYTEKGDTVEVSSPALVIMYNDPELDPGISKEYKGVHYCKLLAPTQMLFWILERAFWTDPLGPGPSGSGCSDAQLAHEDEGGDCRIQDPTVVGSCYFYFTAAERYFCDDYTGASWNTVSAEAKCTDKIPSGVYSEKPCSEREDETGGPTLGECVIGCGTDEEHRWNIYNLDGYADGYEACPMDWFPAE